MSLTRQEPFKPTPPHFKIEILKNLSTLNIFDFFLNGVLEVAVRRTVANLNMYAIKKVIRINMIWFPTPSPWPGLTLQT